MKEKWQPHLHFFTFLTFIPHYISQNWLLKGLNMRRDIVVLLWLFIWRVTYAKSLKFNCKIPQ